MAVPQRDTINKITSNFADTTKSLKDIAITHLSTADTITAKFFRGEHLPSNYPQNDPLQNLAQADSSTEATKYFAFTADIAKKFNPQLSNQISNYLAYLEELSADESLGGEIEAKAISEALQINTIITSIYIDKSDYTWCLHFEKENAPSIHLYCKEDKYWTHQQSTQTNSLFEAIAHELQDLKAPIPKQRPANPNGFFNGRDRELLKKQTLIRNTINNVYKQHNQIPQKLAYQEEITRIKNLPLAEQEQIKKDYATALQLARMQTTSSITNKP